MSDDMITIMSEKFNREDGTQVDGLTLMIDGKIKVIFDKIMKEQEYEDYSTLFRDMVLEGINTLIVKGKNNEQ